MIYQLSENQEVEKLRQKVEYYIEKGELVELKAITKRSLNQNRYLHLLINFVAGEVGETPEFIKESVFKIEANRVIFMVEHESTSLNKTVRYIRSSADLTKEEMTQAIEKFRDFCSLNYGIYLPAPDEDEMVKALLIQANNMGYIK